MLAISVKKTKDNMYEFSFQPDIESKKFETINDLEHYVIKELDLRLDCSLPNNIKEAFLTFVEAQCLLLDTKNEDEKNILLKKSKYNLNIWNDFWLDKINSI